MRQILVTGGTGLVGSHLLFQLTSKGEKPIAIKRKNSDTKNVKNIFSYYSPKFEKLFSQIKWIECDILDILELDKVIQLATHIYHTAALVSFNNSLKQEMIENNATGTSNVVDCALKNNIKKICYVSSIATLGSSEKNIVDENCFWDWTNKSGYATSKYLAEMEVWRAFGEGLEGVIVNPSLIIGPGFWESGIGIIINSSKKMGPFYPQGNCGVISVIDLVEIMIKLMNSNVSNNRFIINAEHISYRDMLAIINKKLNRTLPSIKLPKYLMLIFIYLDIIYCKLTGKKINLSSDAIKYTAQKTTLNSSKINKLIKFKYSDTRKSLDQSVSLYLDEQ